jgi:DNA invertase Pin-like site-specific DNA recombinase
MTVAVVAYARVSTERQVEAQTIEPQLERLRACAAQQGWPPGEADLNRDEGHRGARLGRPTLDGLVRPRSTASVVSPCAR